MQLLFDLLPVIAFVIAYLLKGIYFATTVLIVCVVLYVVISLITHRKMSSLMLAAAGIAIVFGGLTLYLHNPIFIKWKPTIVNVLFASVFAASHLMRGPTILQRMLGESFTLDDAYWRRLNLLWVGFFLFLAAANLYVAYSYVERTWVFFKLFGLSGMTFAFLLLQVAWIMWRSDSSRSGTD